MTRREAPARRGASAPTPAGIAAGDREPIFSRLSEEIVQNMRRPGSESAAIWNAFYAFAHTGIEARAWYGLPRLWGTAVVVPQDDRLTPYFWGLDVEGRPLEGLARSIEEIAGREDRLEVDLILKGANHLIAVEAKVDAEPGRCGRYLSGRCPEVHQVGSPCGYWEPGPGRFDAHLDFGLRPIADMEEGPACSEHYQLGRTLLLVERLARQTGAAGSVCLLIPRRRWAAIRTTWLDFVDRVRDDGLWRRLRVLAWEDLKGLRP